MLSIIYFDIFCSYIPRITFVFSFTVAKFVKYSHLFDVKLGAVSNLCVFFRQILTVLTQLESTDGYSVSHKLQFRISPKNGYGGYGSHQDPPLIEGLSGIHNPRPL